MSDIINDSISPKSRSKTHKLANRLARKFQDRIEELELTEKTQLFIRTLKSNLVANLREIRDGFVNGKRQDRN